MAYSKKGELQVDRWDDFRLFVAVANSASIKRAAGVLGTTQSAVSKRLDRLEKALGTRLFDRGATGTKLTYQGERILPRALAAQHELTLALSEAKGAGNRVEGDCSVLLGDGVANYWVSRFLPAYFDRYPNIELRMILDHDLSAPRNEVFDIRLHYFEPSNTEQIARPLATVHFIPFVSRSYAAKHGVPRSKEDLQSHRVLDLSQYLSTSGSWAAWFGKDTDKYTSLFTNQSAFLAHCVTNGVGIGLMPTYMVLVAPDLIPLDLGLKFTTKLFASYHRERSLKPQVKSTLSYLRNIVFDRRLMPWFRDEFLQPDAEWVEVFKSLTEPALDYNGSAVVEAHR
jgi:DNA-binding transcriptional LysR family regulator